MNAAIGLFRQMKVRGMWAVGVLAGPYFGENEKRKRNKKAAR